MKNEICIKLGYYAFMREVCRSTIEALNKAKFKRAEDWARTHYRKWTKRYFNVLCIFEQIIISRYLCQKKGS